MPATSIYACESQPIAAEGLVTVLSGHPDLHLAGWSQTPGEALDRLRTNPADVVLIDQSAGMKAILKFLADLRALSPETKPVLWAHEVSDHECFRMLQLGVRGVLKKTLPVSAILDCLRSVAGGTIWVDGNSSARSMEGDYRPAPRLTPREREIVCLVCRGLKNKEIATSLSITPGTVKVHLMHIFEKTGVKDRFELAAEGRRVLGEAGPQAPAADFETLPA